MITEKAIEREAVTGRDASFYHKGKLIRFQVEHYLPAQVIYSHRDCATGPVERLELEFADVDTETDIAIYRVVERRRIRRNSWYNSTQSG